jgi:AraC-like DNA-binding protein
MRLLGSYALVFLLDGEGTYRDARGRCDNVQSGDLILIFPDIAHCYGPRSDTHWSEFYIIFEGAVFDLWRERKLLDDERPILHLQPVEYWLRRFEDVINPTEGSESGRSLQQVCRLQTVLAEAIEYSTRSVQEGDVAWLQQARVLLEAGFEQPLPLIARGMGMSYESFRKRFAALSGTSPGQYRLSRQMDRACALVHGSELSNKEIAQRLGFCDEFHFSRQFKKVTGVSPREFRRRLPRGTREETVNDV